MLVLSVCISRKSIRYFSFPEAGCSSLSLSVFVFVSPASEQLRESCTGCIPLNLGTGTGYSVLEVVKSMEEATGFPIPYKVMGLTFDYFGWRGWGGGEASGQ